MTPRQEMPSAAHPRPFLLPEPSVHELTNGMRVITLHVPGQPMVAIELVIPAALHEEPEGLDGISRILVDLLSTGLGGTTSLPVVADHPWLAAAVSVHAEPYAVRLRLDCTTDQLGPAMATLYAAVTPAGFTETLVADVCASHHQSATRAAADPASLVGDLSLVGLFGLECRYGRPHRGTPVTLSAITAKRAGRSSVRKW